MAADAQPAQRRRLADLARDPLLRSAYSLMLNVVLTSGSGVIFWIIATRMYSSATVGRDSALVAAMSVTYMICSLNLSSGIVRFLPVTKMRPQRVIVLTYAITVSLSMIGGTLFVLVAPRVSDQYRFLSESLTLSVSYVAAVGLWGVFTLQDAVLTALRRAPWVPIENGIFGVLKIAALPVMLALGTGDGVFIAWAVPVALLVIPINYLIFYRVLRDGWTPAEGESPIERFGRQGLLRYLAQDYGAVVLMQLASTALPAVLVGLLGSSTSAHFYMPFTIVSAFDLMFLNVATSLTVEAVIDESRTPELVRTVIRRFGPLMLAGVAVFTLGAPLLLAPFGAEYVHHGAAVLRLLALGSVFRAVVSLFTAISRIHGNTGRVLLAQAATFVLVMASTVVLGRTMGLTGVGLAWLGSNGLVALAALPSVLRTLARPGAPEPVSAG